MILLAPSSPSAEIVRSLSKQTAKPFLLVLIVRILVVVGCNTDVVASGYCSSRYQFYSGEKSGKLDIKFGSSATN